MNNTQQQEQNLPAEQPAFFSREGIYFIALGGAEEVGFNMYAYIVDGRIIVVDAGYGFLNDDFPGIELGLPDASFLENYQDRIEALFITHAHEDHFGAIAHIWPKLQCPVYAADFSLGHIHKRLAEYKLDGIVETHSINAQRRIKLQNFEVEFVPVVHSLPDNSMLMIRTKYGNIVHGTDWRMDDGKMGFMPTDYQRLSEIAAEGIDLYVGDSTNMAHEVSGPSESEIRESLINLVPQYKNTLVATCFASNIARLESLILAAHAADRTPVIAGMSMIQNINIAKECGYLPDLPPYVEAKQAMDIPLDKMLYICAGSQANYRSGLNRIVNGENKDIKLGKGDAIIFSSQIIPGNEEKIERMQEKLRDAGVDVISCEEYLVHTSGHACKDDIKKMYKILRPKLVLPVHGDKRNIRAQKRFALECGVEDTVMARNGDVVLINGGKAEIVGEVPTALLGVDRNQITDLGSQLIKNRKRIAFNCSLFISIVFDENWKLEDLQISSIDILEENAFLELREQVLAHVVPEIPEIVVKHDYRVKQIQEYINAAIRKDIFKATGIKPVVFSHFYKRGGNQTDCNPEAMVQPEDKL